MLKNSKSEYFIIKLFTFVNEKTKLDIIKYNKNMQNIMDINLTNYKFFCKRYIIYDENGKGKEYDKYNDYLMFEGEYLYGKRSGKGKEYCGSWLIFEGDYLNGKRNGKGKEYQIRTGELIFDGEYLNGKRNGKGKEYDYNGILQFEGEYLNGKKNGKGKKYYNNEKLYFEGDYINGNLYNLQNNNIEYFLNTGKIYIKEYDEYNGTLRYEG